MGQQIVIVGAGIGGLAAALACGRAGYAGHLIERSAAFSELGAGLQLGPNAVKLLHGWGLAASLKQVAAFPAQLVVRDALSGRELGVLPLGERALQRYGAPYVTVHRADLHALMLQAVQSQGAIALQPNTSFSHYLERGNTVSLKTNAGAELEAAALIGADGLWSQVREHMLHDGLPQSTGHLAYRALLPQASLPQHLRSQRVSTWLGPKLHLVQYPVRGGEWLNVVAIVQGALLGDPQDWDQETNAAQLLVAFGQSVTPLRDLVEAISQRPDAWRVWALYDRPPMSGAAQHAQGRVALLGDAAHPMRPYLAQGAGMALEDAQALGQALAMPGLDMAARLNAYAQGRWQRNAQVQARARRNGTIFHARGPLRWARNLALGVFGERLMDLPWLYGGGPG